MGICLREFVKGRAVILADSQNGDIIVLSASKKPHPLNECKSKTPWS
jgi:hypothetical protein